MEQIIDRVMKGMLKTTEERAQAVVGGSSRGSSRSSGGSSGRSRSRSAWWLWNGRGSLCMC